METAILLALTLECALPATPLPSPATLVTHHVRAEQPELRALVREGLARSSTFRSLMARLEETDVVVYLRTAIITGGLGGFVPHRVAAYDGGRYVMAVVTREGGPNRRIGVIAHELQHALEIGREPDVGRTRSVHDLFKRIGAPTGARNSYETTEAIAVESTVRSEHGRARNGTPEGRCASSRLTVQ
ncbi:MAG: hypothetical protein AB7I50_02960 [Vicinamibacterales bacterium]